MSYTNMFFVVLLLYMIKTLPNERFSYLIVFIVFISFSLTIHTELENSKLIKDQQDLILEQKPINCNKYILYRYECENIKNKIENK